MLRNNFGVNIERTHKEVTASINLRNLLCGTLVCAAKLRSKQTEAVLLLVQYRILLPSAWLRFLEDTLHMGLSWWCWCDGIYKQHSNTTARRQVVTVDIE